MTSDASRLTRALHEMPAFVREAIALRGLDAKYAARPAYQRNDYVGWIVRAKLPETQQKRLAQMLDELEAGGVYMRMRWKCACVGTARTNALICARFLVWLTSQALHRLHRRRLFAG
ncbi:MAG: YdeI/OmpD-associated family protein [Chloroflexota bacterium]